jgi:FkbM family methyltransferase
MSFIEQTGQYSDTSLAHMNALLGPNNSLVAVDVGGANDLQPHWQKLRDIARFVVYEPHEESYRALVEKQSRDPSYRNFLYLNEALWSESGTRTLYQTKAPTGSSLLPPKKGGIADHSRNTYFWPLTTKTIETTTLARSLDRERIGRIDMIKLDTQGTELEILSSLDKPRISELLLVESECGFLDIYEGGERVFEEMLRFMREHGFSLFDLRTTRFLGNAVQLDPDLLEQVLGNELNFPPIAHRLGEVDAVFVRDPRVLMNTGIDAPKLRRLIAILTTYFFFPEAVYAVTEARKRKIFAAREADALLEIIGALKAIAARETTSLSQTLRGTGGLNWAQYMWVPYPSA